MSPDPVTQASRGRTTRLAKDGGLAVVLAVAAAARFWNLDFGLPFAHSRPDEVAVAGPALTCLLGNCRPPDFIYPSLVIYVVATVYGAYYLLGSGLGWYASVAGFASTRHDSLAPFLLLSRGVSAVFGTATVYGIFLLGRRAAGPRVGLVAAWFLALALLHARDSHFGTTDVTMTALVVLAVLRVVAWDDRPTLRNAALAGAAVGLAGSAKYNGLGVATAFVVAAACQCFEATPGTRSRALQRLALSAVVFGAALVVAFLGTSPYILAEWGRFVGDVFRRGGELAAPHGITLPRGWIHHASVSLPASIGWPAYLCGVIGAGGWLATHFRRAVVVLAFPVAYFAVTGSLLTVFARYVLPLVPFLALSAAWLVVTAVDTLLPAATARVRGVITAAVACIVIAPSALEVWHLNRLLGEPDTRIEAARLLQESVVPGQTLFRTGRDYGYVPLDLPRLNVEARRIGFDVASGLFVRPDGAPSAPPDWLVIQRSPLTLYSGVPDTVVRLAASDYRLVASVLAADQRAGRVYDQQDAFFCPLSGLAGVRRLGPDVFLYRRRTLD